MTSGIALRINGSEWDHMCAPNNGPVCVRRSMDPCLSADQRVRFCAGHGPLFVSITGPVCDDR